MKVLTVRSLSIHSMAKRVQRGGREFLVAPVIAAVGGVMNEEWAPAEEFAKTITDWDGQPITIGHPENDGQYISAHEAGAVHVGFLSDPSVNGKFKAQAWLDVDLLQQAGDAGLKIIKNLENGVLTNVSTGYYCDREAGEGYYNGRPYTAVQRNINPDHLAILPDGIGACSVHDGCGIPRTNEGKEEAHMPVKTITIQEDLSLDEQESRVYDAWYAYLKTAPPVPMKASGQLWIRAIYPDYVIVSGHPDGLLQYSYTLDADGGIVFGDAVKVQVVYQPVEMATNERGLFERIKDFISQFSTRSQIMDRAQTLATLKTNGCSLADSTLEKFNDQELGELLAEQTRISTKPTASQPATNSQASPATQPATNGQASQLTMVDIRQAIAEALKPLQVQVETVTANLQAAAHVEKNNIIEALMANTRNPIKNRASLEALSMADLEALDREFAEVDYSGRGVIRNAARGEFITDEEFEANGG